MEKEKDIKDENIKETVSNEEIKEEVKEKVKEEDIVEISSAEEKIKTKLEEKEKQCEELKDRLQRTMAEFDNFRKRTAKEKSALYEDSVRNTIEQILPVIDNFERALSSGEKEDKNSPFLQGMEMVYRQFKDILTSIGVEEIKSVGEKFDPNLHNAVTHIEDETFGESEVVEEFQKGYIFKDKVIRYSMVKVAN